MKPVENRRHNVKFLLACSLFPAICYTRCNKKIMLFKALSAAVYGIDANLIDVEVDYSGVVC